MTQHASIYFVLLLLVLSTCNLVVTMYRMDFSRTGQYTKNYSYIGNDFPETLPMSAVKSNQPSHVLATVEDSVHYPLIGPIAQSEWETIYPSSFGFVRLGSESRIMCVSMFHQLHCVEKMRRALDNPDDPYATIPHLQHCMNYIRQMILCASDLTLEPQEEVGEGDIWGIRNASVIASSGTDVTHSCRNWAEVYDTIEDNYVEWQAYWDEHSGETTVA